SLSGEAALTTFLAFTIVGIATGCIYALTASGLVVTYTTSGIFNFAHGAVGMVCAFTYWELTVEHGWPQIVGLIVVIGVLAPLIGAVVYLLMMRGLHGTTISTQLVITLGLLLVLIGYAAAMVGRLRSLPWTFAGGLALGLAESYTIWKLPTDILNKVRPALPIIFLYIVLLILPQERLSVGRVVSSRRVPRVSTLRESVIGAIALVLGAIVLVQFVKGSLLVNFSQGIVFSLIMLSLVLLV